MGMIRKRSITEQQKDFIRYHVAERRNPTDAARLAGYAFPKQAAYELTRNPRNFAPNAGGRDKHCTRENLPIWQVIPCE